MNQQIEAPETSLAPPAWIRSLGTGLVYVCAKLILATIWLGRLAAGLACAVFLLWTAIWLMFWVGGFAKDAYHVVWRYGCLTLLSFFAIMLMYWAAEAVRLWTQSLVDKASGVYRDESFFEG